MNTMDILLHIKSLRQVKASTLFLKSKKKVNNQIVSSTFFFFKEK